jgi:hypothetical protein
LIFWITTISFSLLEELVFVPLYLIYLRIGKFYQNKLVYFFLTGPIVNRRGGVPPMKQRGPSISKHRNYRPEFKARADKASSQLMQHNPNMIGAN